jgi:hypothetical protein
MLCRVTSETNAHEIAEARKDAFAKRNEKQINDECYDLALLNPLDDRFIEMVREALPDDFIALTAELALRSTQDNTLNRAVLETAVERFYDEAFKNLWSGE